MKRWFVKVDNVERKCELVTAFVSSSFRLMLRFGDSVFMVEFKDRDHYLESRDGGWRSVKIYTLNKKVKKYGICRFSEF